jgi:hypothetical protein
MLFTFSFSFMKLILLVSSQSPKAVAKSKKTEEAAAAAGSEQEEEEAEHNTSTNASETSTVRNSGGHKRTVDRGLDGGYWSRMSVGEMLADNKPKRTRRSVEFLNVSGPVFRYEDEESNSNQR